MLRPRVSGKKSTKVSLPIKCRKINKVNEMKKDVFLGSGLPSLVLALYLAKNHPEKEVVIIEKEAKLGGTNGSVSYVNGEIFDYGMKVYYECNIKQLDEIVVNSLPKEEIFIYSDNKKDLAGCYFNKKIQNYSPCIDLRFIEKEDRIRALGEILTSNLTINKLDYKSAEKYLIAKFGKIICKNGFFPILENLHGKPISELEIEASTIHFGSEERVILFDEDITKDLMKSDILRKRIAFPNQKNLPNEYAQRTGRAIYPKKIGIRNLINGLEKQLLDCGVQIIRNMEIISIMYKDNSIVSISCNNIKDDMIVNYDVEGLYWSSSLPLLANKLGYDEKLNFEIAPKTFLAHFTFDRKTNIEDIYYLFNFDKNYFTFRVVNYNSYCPTSSLDKGYRVTVEYWPKNKEITTHDIFKELIDMKIIDENTKVLFSKKEYLSHGFPLPTLANKNFIRKYRNFIKEKQLSNLILFGQFVEDNVFFIPDILRNGYSIFKKHNLIKKNDI